ncbi:19406_t:CDS:1 [Dentiscutata erythropus]|uniref:19406_t:CDS:1 n=1 Tax=Dentiscutata erythropus TaxID=1348616 RepID=A0A9N9HZC8_9GLOM|nr:19406_t:CDS:1 [Dentiscutata erythropus]
MYLSKRKQHLLDLKFCQKYSFEILLSLEGSTAIRLRKKELIEWLKKENINEYEEYFRINFLHIFNLEMYLKLYKNNFTLKKETWQIVFFLIGDIENIFDSICRVFGNNFITIISEADYRKQFNNEKSPAFVVKEFVRNEWDMIFYDIYDRRKFLFFITKFEVDEWKKNFGKLMYCNEKHYKEKMSWRLGEATILNLKEKKESKIDTILNDSLTNYKFSPNSYA